MKVQIDNREPTHFINYITKKLTEEKYEVEVCQLPVGDIVVPEKGLCVERKSIEDFYSSIGDGRLDVQISQMGQYPTFCIIIMGSSNSETFHFSKFMNEAAFFGAYRSVVLKRKCPTFNVSNNRQFWLVLKSIIKHIDDVENVVVGRPIHVTHENVKMGMLLAVPGVGTEKAARILKQYPTIFDVAAALKNKEFKVKGFGPKLVENLHNSFFSI